MLAHKLQNYMLGESNKFTIHHDKSIMIENSEGKEVVLNLDPPHLHAQNVTAKAFFNEVTNADELIIAYKRAKESLPFEEQNDTAMQHVSAYAQTYLNTFLNDLSSLTLSDVRNIVHFVKELDIYVAVRAIETFLSNRANLELLKIVKENRNWFLVFDHLAIRTGSKNHNDAKRISDMLIKEHGYQRPQDKEQQYYEFSDGWSAFIVYKLLRNGLILRLFVDQSDAKNQIIEHWNHVYGYTAHHLGIRVVRKVEEHLEAVPLLEVKELLHAQDIEVMQPAGLYTQGLLEQVFTKPQVDNNIPEELLESINKKIEDKSLLTAIKNAKLLEIVSRKEVSTELAQEIYHHYQLSYKKRDALFSMPVYHYFLPAQAAHVIKTSIA
jgi:hypothetical protein